METTMALGKSYLLYVSFFAYSLRYCLTMHLFHSWMYPNHCGAW